MAILDYVWQNMRPRLITSRSVTTAARCHGYPGHLLWLQQHGAVFETSTMAALAGRGDLPGMVWLRMQGCPLDERCFAAAVKSGKFKAMWYMMREKCPLAPVVLKKAKSLSVVKWLREQGCPWDEKTLLRFILRGHSKIVTWMLKNGCPVDVEKVKEGEKNYHPLMVKLLQRKGIL